MRSTLILTKPFVLNCSWLASRCSQRSPFHQRFPWALQLKEQILKEQITDDRVFFKMPFHPCPLGCGRFLSADDGHDRCLQCLGIQHTEAAFVDDSCACCGRMNMTSLRSRLSFLKGLAPSAATRPGLSGSRGPPAGALGDLRVTVRASPPGSSPRTSYSSRSERPVRLLGDFAGSSHGMASISFGAPPEDSMSIAALGDGLTSSEDEGAVGLPPSGVVATAAPDPELTAMLARAAASIGLEVNRPHSPEPSRLDDWFLGAGRGSQPRPTPVPFFPEVHEELTKSWMAPFTARSRSSVSSVLTTLDGGAARGYAGIPQVERAVAVHLCPRNAATWRNRPRLPSKACKLTAALAAKAYSAAGQAASALHAMVILQVHQAKALKQMHEGSPDPGLMQELCTATDLALRATKVTARSLGKAMSTMVVQERHLWLNLAEMKDVDKARFLDAPITQAGLFGDTVEGFAQQFSAVQKQTEAIQHILPRRGAPAAAAAPRTGPPSARRRGRPPASSRAAPPRAEAEARPARRASRRSAASPASIRAPNRPGGRRSGPDAGNPEMLEFALSQETTRKASLLPPVEGRVENPMFPFISVPPLAQGSAAPTFSKKEQFPFPPGFQVHRPTVCDALPPHSRPRPILPAAKRARFGDAVPPHAPLASPLWDPGSSAWMLQNALPSVPSSSTPLRCTTTGTSIVPLEPLARRLEAWLALPSPSRWLTRTIRLGYAIQFARRPPKFSGVLETSVRAQNAPVLREEIAVLLAKGAIEPVPPAEMRQGFYSPYFIVPKKGGGLRPILDLRLLNRALHRLPFKMLTHRRMIKCIQPRDWFAAIDLKDAYFHVSILPRHRPFLRFAFEGRAWQYRVLPFGLSLSPRVFTKVVEGALAPLREVGVRILNYLDDWLILAQSREQLCGHRDLVLRHLSQLGLRVNWEKSKLSPAQRISFLGVELDSVSMTARLTEERAQSVLNCLSSFGGRTVVPLKQFQRLLGHMASAAAVTPLGLLHMRPLQHWLHSRVPRWAWRRGALRVNITQECRRSFSPWTDLAFLRAGVPLEQVSRHVVVTTDASSTGWGATCNGQAASGLWTGPRLLWQINCLELLAVHLALRQFRPLLLGKHVLVRTDNIAAVSYINRMGGIRSRRMSQLARHLLLWSHTWLKSLRAVHIPGVLNRAADALSRQLTFPGEWRLHPETIRLIWSRFGEAQVDLFASRESSHCQWFFSLTEGSLGTDALAHSWPRALCKYAFPPVSLLAQTLCKVREDEEQVLLVAPFWPTRTWFPELILLATAPPWRIPLRKDLLSQGLGTIWHPRPDLWNLHVWLLDGTRQT